MNRNPLGALVLFATVALLGGATGCARLVQGPFGREPAMDTVPPPIMREARGVWIATVANIDWPSRDTLQPETQRFELIDLLDRAKAAGFNMVVFHVRPAADAVYASEIEPWAAMLTGTQGRSPGYDPLAFAIEQAHARGLELHAWINPFRAGKTADSARLAPTHVFHTQRDLVRVYGSQLWLDPGEPAARDYSLRVVMDIVRRYDIDGIHADDYYYPYEERDPAGQVIPFPDDSTYTRYGAGLSRDDWRRQNIDSFFERLYREVHAIKPALKVGISPFGIWRPGNPPSVHGLDAYAEIYSDSRKWLRSGWVDYLAPQLYWSISAPQQSFPALLDWWLSEDVLGRHVWPGLAAYRVNNGSARPLASAEVRDQAVITRSREVTGHLLYNATATFKRNGGAVARSLAPLYAPVALMPASPWLGVELPGAPALSASGSSLTITPAAGDSTRWWVLRAHGRTGWATRVLFTSDRTVSLADLDRVLVQAVSPSGMLSSVAEWRH